MKPLRLSRLLILILLTCAWLVLPPGCVAKKSKVQVQPPPEGLARAKHVVIVLVDGLRPDSITTEHSPFLHGALERCAYTLEAQTIQPSVTLPAHASMVSGLPPSEHRITWNTYEPRRGHIQVETIFDVAHEAGLTTALIGGKEKLLHLVRPGVVDKVSTSDRLSHEVMEDALPYIASERPNLILIHLPNLDLVGHSAGWMSEEQLESVRANDDHVRHLFETLGRFPPEESWALILTADHGGHGRYHGTRAWQDTTIPWIVCGGAVEPAELSPVSITATAPTALEILGLETELNAD